MQKIFYYLKLSSLFIVSVIWSSCLSAQPVLKWQAVLGGYDFDSPSKTITTADGGFLMIGRTSSTGSDAPGRHDSTDAWIVKLTSTLQRQWIKCLGGSREDAFVSVQETPNQEFIIVGYTNSVDADISGNHGGFDIWVIKLDKNGNVKWKKCYGGSQDDYSDHIVLTTDGGFLFMGTTFSNNGDVSYNHGQTDVFVAKADSSGNIQWKKSFGGSDYDFGRYVQQTSDGGYIISASTSSTDGDVSGHHNSLLGTYYETTDFWILKIDSAGNIQWQKCLGGTDDDDARNLLQTHDGNYVVFGNTTSKDGDVSFLHGAISPYHNPHDYWIVKLDTGGNILWEKTFGGSYEEKMGFGVQTPDNGFIIAGSTRSKDGDVSFLHQDPYYGVYKEDYWIVKLDSAANLLWEKSYGGIEADFGNHILPLTKGGYIVSGSSYSDDGDVSGHNNSSSNANTDSWIFILRPDEEVVLCPNSNYTISSSLKGSTYQWQVNDGNGFLNISNNATYNGANSPTLIITNVSSTLYGYQYRCLVDGKFSLIKKLIFSNTFTGKSYSNFNWSNPSNWSCGKIPDANTDVVIKARVDIDVNAFCRTIVVLGAGNVKVTNGSTLTVTK